MLEKTDAKDKPSPVKIDWAGISQRLWQVSVDSGNYSELRAVDGRLYLLDQAMGDDAEPSLMTIKFDPLSPKAEVFALKCVRDFPHCFYLCVFFISL